MSMEKRTFTKEEKLQILNEVSERGVTATLEQHGIYPATYYSWKKKYETMGEAGFRHGMTPGPFERDKAFREREFAFEEAFGRKRDRRILKR